METTPAIWQPGTHITVRNIWQGQVFSAYPFVVVEDTSEWVATYVPPGTGWKRPVDLQGRDIRLPYGEWKLRDDAWYGDGVDVAYVDASCDEAVSGHEDSIDRIEQDGLIYPVTIVDGSPLYDGAVSFPAILRAIESRLATD